MWIIMLLLFILYALPLFVVGIATFTSSWFVEASVWVEFSVALSSLYLGPIRDTLGTFVVPFITASYAVTSLHNGIAVGGKTIAVFIGLVILFALSVFISCEVQIHADDLVRQLNTDNQELLREFDEKLKNMSESYMKEILGYISLLLGINLTTKVKEND